MMPKAGQQIITLQACCPKLVNKMWSGNRIREKYFFKYHADNEAGRLVLGLIVLKRFIQD